MAILTHEELKQKINYEDYRLLKANSGDIGVEFDRFVMFFSTVILFFSGLFCFSVAIVILYGLIIMLCLLSNRLSSFDYGYAEESLDKQYGLNEKPMQVNKLRDFWFSFQSKLLIVEAANSVALLSMFVILVFKLIK